jgi:DNA-binding beta-propeller fold protein YncE
MRRAAAWSSGTAAGPSAGGFAGRAAGWNADRAAGWSAGRVAGWSARPWVSLTPLAVLAVIAALVTGCTSGASSPGAASVSRSASAVAGSASASATASEAGAAPAETVPGLPSQALASPGCSAATAAGPALGSVHTETLAAGTAPFGVAATPDGRWAFAAVAGAVDVLRLSAGDGSTSAPLATPVRSVPLPVRPLGATVTPDGRYLLLAAGTGAVVVSVARAEAGTPGSVLGTLALPAGTRGAGPSPGPGDTSSAIEVTTSPDGRFAFVTLEYADEAVVFNLAAALAHGFGPADYVGAIPLGNAAVGMAVSPDGRWLYATSEVAVAGQLPPGPASAERCAGKVPGTATGEPPGALTVIDLARAETDPAHSVVATVAAGYQPVRVVTSADGTQVWVTARASDDLLCFSAARLASDPARALVAIIRVGSEPVGLAAVRGGALIVVADSNRFAASGASSALSVVNVATALAGRPAVTGEIRTGMFPRDMTVSPDGTLLVSDFSSGQVQAVGTASLP